MVLMANRYILPAAYRYQGSWRRRVAAVKAAGAHREGGQKALDEVVKLTDAVPSRASTRCRSCSSTKGDGDAEKHAKYFRDKVIPAMARSARSRRRARRLVPQRSVAAADLPRDAVRQVEFGGLCPPAPLTTPLAGPRGPAPARVEIGRSRPRFISSGARGLPGAFFALLLSCRHLSRPSTLQRSQHGHSSHRCRVVGQDSRGPVRPVGLHLRRDRGPHRGGRRRTERGERQSATGLGGRALRRRRRDLSSICYGVFGAIGGAITAAMYNFIAGMVGGLSVETE